MNFGLEHLGLSAKDPEGLKRWYMSVLGAKLVFHNGESPQMFLLALPGGVMIEIYTGEFALKETSNNLLNGWRHVALRVDSIESARKMLEKNGVRFTEEIKAAGGGGRVLFFQDPEGNLLHLIERSGDSAVR